MRNGASVGEEHSTFARMGAVPMEALTIDKATNLICTLV